MLNLGINDYSVLEGRKRIGRIRLAGEHMPPVWLWSVTIHLTGGLPTGSAKVIDSAKAEFKAAAGKFPVLVKFRHSAHAIASPVASVTTISQSAVSQGRKNMGEIVTAPAGSVS